MGILNFSGFKDAYTYAQSTTLPAGLNAYMAGKFPCFNGDSVLMKDNGITYSFDASFRHQFKFNNNLNEYGVYGFDATKFVGQSAPVGATLTFGFLLNTSIARAVLACWFSNFATSAAKQVPGGPAATGDRYIEVQVRKTGTDLLTITSVNNGVVVGTTTYSLTDMITSGKWIWIGYSGAIAGDRFGETNATLHFTDMYVSYNKDGQDEFLGRPTITRVGATVVDRGGWTNSGGTYTDADIGTYTTKNARVSLAMDTVPTINAVFANSRLSDNPIVFRGENFTPTAGTSIRAIQVTAMSKSVDSTVRTPQAVVLKNADTGDKISGAGTNALNVSSFTPTSAMLDSALATGKLIVEVSASDYKP